MDAFAAALAARAGLPADALGATYAASEDAGIARLRAPDASIALVSLPFFLKHEKALALRPRRRPWSRAARRRSAGAWSPQGRVATAAALEGFTILSAAGFSPAFVRGPRWAAGGSCPRASRSRSRSGGPVGAAASRRRRAGRGAARRRPGGRAPPLPLAAELEVVARLAGAPPGVVAVVDRRVPAVRWAKLSAALRELPAIRPGPRALAGIRLARFVPLDAKALSAARAAHAEARR